LVEAHEKDSFSNFYYSVVERIMQRLVDELPSKRELIAAIRKALLPPTQMEL